MDKIRLKVLIKRAILDGIKYHYEMAELGRSSNFDQFAEDRLKDFETACGGNTSETGEGQSNIPDVNGMLFAFWMFIHNDDTHDTPIEEIKEEIEMFLANYYR